MNLNINPIDDPNYNDSEEEFNMLIQNAPKTSHKWICKNCSHENSVSLTRCQDCNMDINTDLSKPKSNNVPKKKVPMKSRKQINIDKIKKFRARLKSEATFVAKEMMIFDELINDKQFPPKLFLIEKSWLDLWKSHVKFQQFY